MWWFIINGAIHYTRFSFQVAAEVAAPLAQCNKVVMVSSGPGDVGAGKLTGEVLDIITKVHQTVTQLTGAGVNVSRHKNHQKVAETA